MVNLKQWREAQHWYIEAAANRNKAALEALGMLYQTDDSRYRGDEAVELLIRSSSDPRLSTSSDTTTADKKALEQDLAMLLGSENAQCCEPRLDWSKQKETTGAAPPCVAYCAHDNELFCDGREPGNTRLSACRPACVQTDATMLWTELPRIPEKRRSGRHRGPTHFHGDASEHKLASHHSENTGYGSSDDDAGGGYTSAQHLILKGDALYFGHGTKANPAGAVKLYIQGVATHFCRCR